MFLFHNDEQVCTGHLSQGVYVLEHIKPLLYTASTSSSTHTQTVNYTYLWHCRLGHISENRIHKLYKDGFLERYEYELYPTCEPCLLGKMTKTPFTGKGEKAPELD